MTVGADRYLYISSAIVIAPCLAALFDNIVTFSQSRKNRYRFISYIFGGLYCFICVRLIVSCHEAQKPWENSIRLWDHAHQYVFDRLSFEKPKQAAYGTEITLNLADAYREFDNLEKSLLLHNDAIALFNRSASAYNNKANLLLEMKRYKEALISGKKALEIDPKMPEAMANVAISYDGLEESMSALHWYEKAYLAADLSSYKEAYGKRSSKSDSKRVLKSAEYWLAYGNAVQANGNPNGIFTAYECFQKAYLLNPLLPVINEKMARFEVKLDKKLDMLFTELSNNPSNADAAFNAGNVYNKLKKYEEAVVMYKRSLELGPPATDALSNIAIIYYKHKNDCTEASRWALRTIKLDPSHKKGNIILKNCQSN